MDITQEELDLYYLAVKKHKNLDLDTVQEALCQFLEYRALPHQFNTPMDKVRYIIKMALNIKATQYTKTSKEQRSLNTYTYIITEQNRNYEEEETSKKQAIEELRIGQILNKIEELYPVEANVIKKYIFNKITLVEMADELQINYWKARNIIYKLQEYFKELYSLKTVQFKKPRKCKPQSS